jgi:hypothetical protein
MGQSVPPVVCIYEVVKRLGNHSGELVLAWEEITPILQQEIDSLEKY